MRPDAGRPWREHRRGRERARSGWDGQSHRRAPPSARQSQSRAACRKVTRRRSPQQRTTAADRSRCRPGSSDPGDRPPDVPSATSQDGAISAPPRATQALRSQTRPAAHSDSQDRRRSTRKPTDDCQVTTLDLRQPRESRARVRPSRRQRAPQPSRRHWPQTRHDDCRATTRAGRLIRSTRRP